MPDAPIWLDLAGEMVGSAGCRICVRRLGPPGRAPLLLVHGGGGHTGWWIDVAPELAGAHDVIALDLSGNGDSEHRSRYDAHLWAGDLAAAIEHSDAGPVTVVAHSMGGLVSTFLAAERPDLVAGLILLDSPIPRRTKPSTRVNRLRIYATREEAMANFRLRPRGTIAPPERLAAIARHGLRETDNGWRWKFDPAAAQRIPPEQVAEMILRVRCPIGSIFGERSEIVTAQMVEELQELLGRTVPTVLVRDAYHHISIDDPAATVAAVEQILACFAEERST